MAYYLRFFAQVIGTAAATLILLIFGVAFGLAVLRVAMRCW